MIKVGIDIVQIPRIQKMWNSFNMKFANRLLHKLELLEFQRCYVKYNGKGSFLLYMFNRIFSYKNSSHCSISIYLAKKFAAKEAVSKALGTGLGSFINFKDIRISHNDLGAPIVHVDNEIISKIFPDYTKFDIQISITDDYPVSAACAVLNLIK